MRTQQTLIFSVFFICMLASCSSATQLKTSWKAPDVRQINFKKVIALVLINDQATTRNAETQICKHITKIECVPAFAVIADEDRSNSEKVSQRIDAQGFDGVVILRYSGERTEQTYVPSTTTMYGYYGYGYGVAYSPGYVQEDHLVYVETTVYSAPDRKLLWAGTTESLNPSNVSETVDEIATAIAEKMRKQGLIPAE